MTVATKIAGAAFAIGMVNIVLSFIGILLGGGGEFLLYAMICIAVVTAEAMYLDRKRFGYVPNPFNPGERL